MNYCPNYCPVCGRVQPASSDVHRKCPHCGSAFDFDEDTRLARVIEIEPEWRAFMFRVIILAIMAFGLFGVALAIVLGGR